MRVRSWCAMFLSAALCIQVIPAHGAFGAMPVQAEENGLKMANYKGEEKEDEVVKNQNEVVRPVTTQRSFTYAAPVAQAPVRKHRPEGTESL